MALWKQLSIYTSEGSRAGTRALHTALMAAALEQGLYSAIAVKAMAGFGPQMAIPTANGLAGETDLPVEVRIISDPESIEAFLESQKEVLTGCIIIQADIDVLWGPAT